jgi:hypothetical protein
MRAQGTKRKCEGGTQEACSRVSPQSARSGCLASSPATVRSDAQDEGIGERREGQQEPAGERGRGKRSAAAASKAGGGDDALFLALKTKGSRRAGHPFKPARTFVGPDVLAESERPQGQGRL